MKPYSLIYFHKLELSGFKHHENLVKYRFGKRTFLLGGNGTGKSTIADAIAFAVTGYSYSGNRQLELLHNKNNPSLRITLIYSDEGNKFHCLTRIRELSNKNNKKEYITKITLDNVPVQQSDLDILFGGKDIFLSIFNPGYFTSLSRDEGRTLLMDLLPKISQDQVLPHLDDYTKDILKPYIEKGTSIESLVHSLRQAIKELEDNDFYNGKETMAQEQITKNNAVVAELDQEISELESKIEAEESNQDLSQGKAYREALEKLQGIDADLSEIQSRQYVSVNTDKIADLKAQLDFFKERHKLTGEAIQKLEPGFDCPACGTSVTQENCQSMKANMEKSLQDILDKGREFTRQLKELMQKEAEARADFLADQKKLLMGKQEERDEILESITGIKQNMSDLPSLKSLLTAKQKQKERIISTNPNLTEIKSEKEDLDRVIGQYKVELDVAVRYCKEKSKLVLNNLTMNKVTTVLERVLPTTGEVQSDFRIEYEEKSFRCLSLSERLRAGLEISQLIKRLAKRNVPIFIDNAECVNTIDNIQPQGQIFMAHVDRSPTLVVNIQNQGIAKVS